MRNSDPILWPASDIQESLRTQIQKNYTDCINVLQTQWYQADLDQRFVMGDQDVWGLIFPGVATYRRKIWNFNIMNSLVQAISGFQRQSRKSSIAIPIKNISQKTADQLTKCLYYVHNQANASYNIYSDAFEQGALVQGIGFVSIFMDRSADPISGEIKMRYVDFKSVLCDPYFRRHDLSDCRFIWTRQFFDFEELIRFYPQLEDKIRNIPRGGYRDDKFYYMPEVYQIQFPNLVAFDEYWYLSSREALYLVDVITNEQQEFTGDEEDMRIIKLQFGERFKLIKRSRPTVRRCIMLNDKVILDEPNPYGIDRYPFVPFLGYFTPDTAYYAYKFRGIIRDMRDTQYLFNRTKIGNLDIIESQQQGLIIKEGSLVTPDDALNVGHGKVLVRRKDTTLEDVQHMDISPPSPVMLQMEEMLKNLMYHIAGMDPNSIGIDVDDKAGIITMMRQAATARNLQRLFDQLDESQRLCDDIVIEMIQKNWTFTKIQQVIGEEPTPEFDNKLFFQYGCKVIQGVLTESQQQLELGQLLHLKEILGEATPPAVIQRIIDAMYITGKDELKKDIAQAQQQQAQQQQQMAQLQMQQMQVDNETKLAYAQSQKGLAAERTAKIKTDMAIAEDKLKRAEQEDTASLLNYLKAIKELENMDTSDLQAKINLLKSLEEPAIAENAQAGELR